MVLISCKEMDIIESPKRTFLGIKHINIGSNQRTVTVDLLKNCLVTFFKFGMELSLAGTNDFCSVGFG
jgi:hypothetical protein